MSEKKITKEVAERVLGYVDLLKPDIKVSSVYVFGSQAKGTANKHSDIDVAIISPDFTDDSIKTGFYLQRKLWDAPYKNMDVVGYSPYYFENEDSPLIHEIKTHGLLLI